MASVDTCSWGISCCWCFTIGSGILTLIGPKISLEAWVTIQVSRSGQDVTLSIDRKQVTGRTPGLKSGLMLTSDLWVGGVNSSVFLPTEVKFQKGFIGCIQHVKVCLFLLRQSIK